MDTTIGDLGEFGAIARVTPGFPQTDDVILGIGDDAAVVRAPDRRVVATTDLLVEGRHFRRDWSSARDIGHKAAAQNIADVVAMGARPTALLIGLAAPPDLPASWLDDFALGVRAECARVGGTVVGGDTTRSADGAITLSVTALGDLGGRDPIVRSGARVGDRVAVAGRLGWSAAGLALLTHGIDEGPCVGAHRRPEPLYAAGMSAGATGATAMADVSDGLVADLGHIAAASGVGVELDASLLGEPAELREAREWLATRDITGDLREWQLAGGEDHSFAATFPPDGDPPPPWRVIGVVTEGEGVRVDGRNVARGGWDHFGPASERSD
ncbi:thiamine-phosphate kinase [Spiractinospora alimapuensis]|uniref:thiamine-phosphate kinase n=1 Tax=Spiractinospora alimapuensis TaxID=2820884 RepID=UPI001EEBF02D|nr:thiamine-phosphate kinase [Spiractinospora alimapuensis]QVQ51656.1 thiamine-phosphate kinase [Spiractinospora alimapuensis]